MDENDNPPEFDQSTYEVPLEENPIEGAFVTQITATDEDSGLNGELRYTMVPGQNPDDAFTIDAASGIVTVQNNSAFDFEVESTLIARIKAEDMGDPVLSAETLVCY